ncbi:6342_t:CDS:2, partial [Funneliformis geosporum]
YELTNKTECYEQAFTNCYEELLNKIGDLPDNVRLETYGLARETNQYHITNRVYRADGTPDNETGLVELWTGGKVNPLLVNKSEIPECEFTEMQLGEFFSGQIEYALTNELRNGDIAETRRRIATLNRCAESNPTGLAAFL